MNKINDIWLELWMHIKFLKTFDYTLFLKIAFTDKKNLKTFLTLNIYFINQSVLFSTRPSALKKAKTVTNNSLEKGM